MTEITLNSNLTKNEDERLINLYLETDRLIIRRLNEEDINDEFELRSQRDTCLNNGYEPFDKMNDEFRMFFDSLLEEQTRYAIELKENNKMIGSIHLERKDDRAVLYYDMGYSISENYRRRGYAYEATTALMQYCFGELNIPLMTASTSYWNDKSMKLLDKLGFESEGIIRKAMNHEILGPVDMISFYIENNVD